MVMKPKRLRSPYLCVHLPPGRLLWGGVLLSLTETYVSFFDEFGAEPMDLGKPGWGKHWCVRVAVRMWVMGVGLVGMGGGLWWVGV